jgi:hypothetical protein
MISINKNDRMNLSVESFGRISALSIIAGLYILGFLSINAFLQKYNLADFTFLRTRYLYTGTLVVLSVFGSYILPVLGIYIIRTSLALRKNFLVVIQVFILAVILIPGSSFLHTSILMYFNKSIPTLRLLLLSSMISVLGFTLGYSVQVLVSVISKQGKTKISKKYPELFPYWVQTLYLSVVVIFSLAIFLVFFSAFIMPYVPTYLGGTAPQEIRLFVIPDAVEGLEEAGMKFEKDSSLSAVHTLLYEGEDYLLLRVSDNGTLKMNRDLTQAILYTDKDP